MSNITNADIYKALIGIQNDMQDMKSEFNTKIDAVEERLNKRIDGLDVKIDAVEERLNNKIDNVEKNLRQHIKKEIKETEEAVTVYLDENFIRKKCV